MTTIKLKVNESVYDKIMWFLSKFSKEEIEILENDEIFQEQKNYLAAELKEILDGDAELIDFDRASAMLDAEIKGRENSI